MQKSSSQIESVTELIYGYSEKEIPLSPGVPGWKCVNLEFLADHILPLVEGTYAKWNEYRSTVEGRVLMVLLEPKDLTILNKFTIDLHSYVSQ